MTETDPDTGKPYEGNDGPWRKAMVERCKGDHLARLKRLLGLPNDASIGTVHELAADTITRLSRQPDAARQAMPRHAMGGEQPK